MSSEVNTTVLRPPTSFHYLTPPKGGGGGRSPGEGGNKAKVCIIFQKMISLKRIHPRKNRHSDSLG
jgi:hypothetical protein